MCGVGAVLLLDPRGDAAPALRRIAEALVHRGPDAEGMTLADGRSAGLAHRRLSILDLETGDQPMANEDGSVHLAFNGEIYNYLSLRDELQRAGHRFVTRSDTEVVLHGWEEWGEALPTRLNGIFAFALLDCREAVRGPRLFLARDPVGAKPLYLGRFPGGWWVASELQAARRAGLAGEELLPEALGEFLVYRFVPAPRTPFRNAWKLPPSSSILIDRTTLASEPLFRPYRYAARGGSMPTAAGEWEEALRAGIRDAVSRQLMSDVPVGSLLSGGVDSVLVTSLMTDASGGRAPQCFAIGFDDDRPGNELLAARRAAGALHAPLCEVVADDRSYLRTWSDQLGGMGEPIANSGVLLVGLLCQQVRKTHKVVLSGHDAGSRQAACRRPVRTVPPCGVLRTCSHRSPTSSTPELAMGSPMPASVPPGRELRSSATTSQSGPCSAPAARLVLRCPPIVRQSRCKALRARPPEASVISDVPAPSPHRPKAVPTAIRTRLPPAIATSLGSLLSRGVDSVLVTSLMTDASGGRAPQCFAIGFDDDRPGNELLAARRAAGALHAPLCEVVADDRSYLRTWSDQLGGMGEPIANSGVLLVGLLCEQVRKTHKVVLSGQGADEPLGGYPRHVAERFHGLARQLAPLLGRLPDNLLDSDRMDRLRRLARHADEGRRFTELLAVFQPEEAARLLCSPMAPDALTTPMRAALALGDGDDHMNRFLMADARLSLADDLLLVADQMAMAHSVELRVPFLDLELLHLIFKMPSRFKISRWGERKWFYRRTVARLLPRSLRRSLVGPRARLGRKLGFATPLDRWFAGWAQRDAERALLGPGALTPSVLDSDKVRTLVREARDHGKPRSRQLMSLFVLESWLRALHGSASLAAGTVNPAA